VRADRDGRGRQAGVGADGARQCGAAGTAVQVEPIKPMLKAPGNTRLNLRYDGPLSKLAFNFNSHRYTLVEKALAALDTLNKKDLGRGLHSFTSQFNLSRFGNTSACPPV